MRGSVLDGPNRELYQAPTRIQKIELTALVLYRGPYPERFTRLGVGLCLNKGVVSLAGLYSGLTSGWKKFVTPDLQR